MAQEKPRATRARTKKTEEPAAEPAPKKAPTRPRARKKPAETVTVMPTDEAIAFHAYLLWERGEPGGPEEHWYRAERELVAA